MITSRLGLNHVDARSGVAISIPTATVLLLGLAPFTIELSSFNLTACLIFAAVGLIYPALVTLLTFRSNEQLGPTITSAISGTAPLFAMLGAALLLGERVAPQAALAGIAVAVGVALLSWRPGSLRAGATGRSLLWPITGTIVRGFAQVGAKAGLLLWGNPFATSVIGYVVSSTVVLGASRWRGGGHRTAGRTGMLWFVATGAINGSAMVLMYAALASAPVSTVAPVIAAYPVVTALGSALLLRNEPVNLRMLAGTALTVSAIAWLLASGTG